MSICVEKLCGCKAPDPKVGIKFCPLHAQAEAMAGLLAEILRYWDSTWPDMHFGYPEQARALLRVMEGK